MPVVTITPLGAPSTITWKKLSPPSASTTSSEVPEKRAPIELPDQAKRGPWGSVSTQRPSKWIASRGAWPPPPVDPVEPVEPPPLPVVPVPPVVAAPPAPDVPPFVVSSEPEQPAAARSATAERARMR